MTPPDPHAPHPPAAEARPDSEGPAWRRAFTVGPPLLWLCLFALLPLMFVLRLSFSESRLAMPPYRPLIETNDAGDRALNLNTENYRLITGDSLYRRALANSVRIALISTFITLILGYGMAWAIVNQPAHRRPLLLMAIILPFWTSFLIRTYAWIGILKREGLLNEALLALGVIAEPLTILHTETAIVIGIVYGYLPFMILPIYASLGRMDRDLLEASGDLGARPLRTFLSVTVPLSLPGVAAGCFLVLIPAVGEFVIPDLLGGSETLLIGQTIWTEFFSNRDWPVASAAAIVLLMLLAAPFVLLYRARSHSSDGAWI